ncbi:MAG TPA: formyl transferase [Hyphomonadaceae bacterium]|nr:formyl transferase [Hyphomonadaceae bacterium]
MTKPSLAALTAGGPHAWILLHALTAHFGRFPILVEDGEASAVFWRRRLRLLGPVTVASQIAAIMLAKITKPLSRARQAEVLALSPFPTHPGPDLDLRPITSVNAPESRALLQDLAPKAVFVVGTRKISAATLQAIPAPFVNYHSGLNPAYRGMNGGYFALAAGQPAHFASTLHLVDTGIDTGAILATQHVATTRQDNLHTYVPLMAAQSIDMTIRTMERVLAGDLTTMTSDLPSKQYYHPGVFEYVRNGFLRSVW